MRTKRSLISFRVLIFLIGVAFCGIAEAGPSANSSNLKLWEDAKIDPAFAPAPVIAAGDKVSFLYKEGNCSGQFTSPDGLFLTALHCVYSALKEIGPNMKGSIDKDLGTFKWSVTDPSQLPFRIMDFYKTQIDGILNTPTVIATGRGLMVYPPNIRSQADFALAEKQAISLKPYQEDFAILKFATNGKRSCVNLADHLVSGAQAWAFGFPMDEFDLKDSNRKFVSKGQIFLSFQELADATRDTAVHPEEAWLDFERYAIFSGSLDPGMSGGGVFDERGKLLGTVVATLSGGHGILQRIDFIQRSLGIRDSELLTCPTQ